jgi:hypothetical protein
LYNLHKDNRHAGDTSDSTELDLKLTGVTVWMGLIWLRTAVSSLRAIELPGRTGLQNLREEGSGDKDETNVFFKYKSCPEFVCLTRTLFPQPLNKIPTAVCSSTHFFRKCYSRPDRPWGPPSLLYNLYRVSFPGVKRPGRGVDHPPPSSARVKERVELYLYSPSGPSWPVIG